MTKVIIIYGPPASGKLTVAKELSKLTGCKILHNHLTLDLVGSIMDFNHKNFWNYVRKFRYDILDILAKEKIDVVLTSGYDPKIPDNFQNISQIVEKNKGKIYFVQLCPKKEVLMKRVKEESRKKYGKPTSTRQLIDFLDKFESYATFPNKDNLKIDNSNISAKEVAKRIKEYFNLK